MIASRERPVVGRLRSSHQQVSYIVLFGFGALAAAGRPARLDVAEDAAAALRADPDLPDPIAWWKLLAVFFERFPFGAIPR